VKILLACPTHISKNYAFPAWLDSVRAIIAATTHTVEVFVVDNSPLGEMKALYDGALDKLTFHVLPSPSEHPYERINASMEVIRLRLLAGNYDRWFNLESDIIAPSNIIDVLVRGCGAEVDWCGHGYPVRGGSKEECTGIGCAMLSRDLAAAFSFKEANQDSPDVFLWELVKNDGRFKTVEIWRIATVQHLAE
jgi:hypothetical protein